MTVATSTTYTILRELSGTVTLLNGSRPIADAGRRGVDLAAAGSPIRFGPAEKDWLVTGYAVSGVTRHLTRRLPEPIEVREGQYLELRIAATVSDE